MRLLDSFGPALECCEGLADLSAGKSRDGVLLASRVPFEARQLYNGQIVCGWMTCGPVESFDAEVLQGDVHDPPANIRIHGLQVFHSSISPRISSGVAYGSEMRIEGALASKDQPTSVEFTMVNLPFEPSARPPLPFELMTDGYRLRFSPLPDYEQTHERLKHLSGVAPTAACAAARPDQGIVSPEEVAGTVGSVCTALSLATGNKVAWINWRTTGQQAFTTKLHASAAIRSFGNTIMALGWQLDFEDVVRGWLALTYEGKRYLSPLVDYFLDAAGEGTYLQTRALTTASLLDSVTSHYAERTGSGFLFGDGEWGTMKSKLRGNLKEIHPLLELNMNALRRRPFKENLARLFSDHDLPVEDVDKIVRIRDRLIHSGEFLKGTRPWDQYLTLLRAAYATLSRLAGYSGDIWARLTWRQRGED